MSNNVRSTMLDSLEEITDAENPDGISPPGSIHYFRMRDGRIVILNISQLRRIYFGIAMGSHYGETALLVEHTRKISGQGPSKLLPADILEVCKQIESDGAIKYTKMYLLAFENGDDVAKDSRTFRYVEHLLDLIDKNHAWIKRHEDAGLPSETLINCLNYGKEIEKGEFKAYSARNLADALNHEKIKYIDDDEKEHTFDVSKAEELIIRLRASRPNMPKQDWAELHTKGLCHLDKLRMTEIHEAVKQGKEERKRLEGQERMKRYIDQANKERAQQKQQEHEKKKEQKSKNVAKKQKSKNVAKEQESENVAEKVDFKDVAEELKVWRISPPVK